MLRCRCGMMIECEVKTGQTVESIEHARREGGHGVGVKPMLSGKGEHCVDSQFVV